MTTFEPELGQALCTNTPWGEIETPYWVTAGIDLLAALTSNGDPQNDVTSNHGPAGNFDNGTFALRAYCWCDGEQPGHEEGCPPNFECGDFKAQWYKHSHRGQSQNRAVSLDEWRGIMQRCLASL